MSGPTYLVEHLNCRCGRKSVGELKGRRNESYGFFCRPCAKRELAATERKRRKGEH